MRTLSPKMLRELSSLVATHPNAYPFRRAALLLAIDACLKPKRSVKAASSRRSERKATKREKTAEVYAIVDARAGGFCEACDRAFGDADPGEHDHVFGGASRRSLESSATVWKIHRSCHRLKTDNRPSAAHWLRLFREHCYRHDLQEAAQEAEKRIDWHEAKAVAR